MGLMAVICAHQSPEQNPSELKRLEWEKEPLLTLEVLSSKGKEAIAKGKQEDQLPEDLRSRTSRLWYYFRTILCYVDVYVDLGLLEPFCG